MAGGKAGRGGRREGKMRGEKGAQERGTQGLACAHPDAGEGFLGASRCLSVFIDGCLSCQGFPRPLWWGRGRSHSSPSDARGASLS